MEQEARIRRIKVTLRPEVRANPWRCPKIRKKSGACSQKWGVQKPQQRFKSVSRTGSIAKQSAQLKERPNLRTSYK